MRNYFDYKDTDRVHMERFELGCVFFSNDLRVYDNLCLVSAAALNTELKRFGQRIDRLVVKSKADICSYIDEFNPNVIYRSWQPRQSANNYWEAIKKAYPEIDFKEEFTSTLFDESQLPFESNHFPATFSKFRRAV